MFTNYVKQHILIFKLPLTPLRLMEQHNPASGGVQLVQKNILKNGKKNKSLMT